MSLTTPYKRLLLTGAAGNLGQQVRRHAGAWCEVLRLSDIVPLIKEAPHEEVMPVDLADREKVDGLLQDVDAVIHFGGISVEAPFDDIIEANIRGLYNLYSAAQHHGVRRIIFASSNHAVGFYSTSQVLDTDAPPRADGMYGLSKAFGEQLSRYYYDRFGLESVCIRIGSSFEEPKNRRMLSTYLSHRDLVELLRCALMAPRVDHCIVYGVSDNSSLWWDNGKAAFLGYRPQDSSRPFAANFPAALSPEEAKTPAARYQGGPFIEMGPMEPWRKT